MNKCESKLACGDPGFASAAHAVGSSEGLSASVGTVSLLFHCSMRCEERCRDFRRLSFLALNLGTSGHLGGPAVRLKQILRGSVQSYNHLAVGLPEASALRFSDLFLFL